MAYLGSLGTVITGAGGQGGVGSMLSAKYPFFKKKFLAAPCGMEDLSSSTRNQACLNHWTTWEVLAKHSRNRGAPHDCSCWWWPPGHEKGCPHGTAVHLGSCVGFLPS